MKAPFPGLLTLWTLTDLLRRPATTSLTAVALLLLSFFSGTVLLLNQALDDTAGHLLSRSPSLVIRRLNAGGWAPIPVAPALNAAGRITGVIAPRTRIWGAAAGPDGPLTILAVDKKIETYLKKHGLPLPAAGQAVVGKGVNQNNPEGRNRIELSSSKFSIHLDIIARLPADSEMAAYDLVLTTPKDARSILNIPEDMASDLVLDVFHQEEADALMPELSDAFPWPVRITSRKAARKQLSGRFAVQGALFVVLLIPAILALVLLILAGGRDFLARRSEAGLLRALGWTSGDLARMQFLRSAMVCVPSVCLGLSGAYAIIFFPQVQWIGNLYLGWTLTAPAYCLSSVGAGLIMAEIFALIAMPYILASMWPVLVLAAQPPLSLLKGNHQG